MDKRWKLPEYFNERFNRIGSDYLQFVFEQAEKKLIETVRTGEAITERTYRMTGITLFILTGLLINFLSSEDKLSEFYLATCLSIPLCLGSIILLLSKPLHGSLTHGSGSSPASLLKKELVEDFGDEDQRKRLLLRECIGYQEKIDHHKKLNRQRTANMNIAVYTLAFIPVTIIIATVFVNIVL
jgi:hypothetical protein